MRHVLYANDFEPITIIELNPWQENHIRRHNVVRLPVFPSTETMQLSAAPTMETCRIVTIKSELIYRGSHPLNYIEHMLLFTGDEESALLLKAAFLPGQRSELNKIQREAFANGFLQALRILT